MEQIEEVEEVDQTGGGPRAAVPARGRRWSVSEVENARGAMQQSWPTMEMLGLADKSRTGESGNLNFGASMRGSFIGAHVPRARIDLAKWNLSKEDEVEILAVFAGLIAARKVSDRVERARMRFREAARVVIHINRIKDKDNAHEDADAGDRFFEMIRAIVEKQRADNRGTGRKWLLDDAQDAVISAVREGVNALMGAPLGEQELKLLRAEFDSVDKEGKGSITQQQLE
mmetsp:Transcript_31992/g.81431  ORF Transcript_31992/g.81431 Transcript_31992/m.81431 type:complete len:229 (-) Transcript_31992:57-743(-)